MPVTVSKLDHGTLTIGVVSFATQARNVTLTPDHSSEDPITVLSGDVIGGASTTTWTLKITAIQDFDDPDGFVAYAFVNNGLDKTFSWKPNNDADGVTYGGTVTVRAVEIGGDVATNLETSAEWPVVGDITPTYPA